MRMKCVCVCVCSKNKGENSKKQSESHKSHIARGVLMFRVAAERRQSTREAIDKL